jgi:peptidase E
LQFQYIALIRYCQNTHATRKSLHNALAETEKKLVTMQDLASEEHAKVLSLQQENERLRARKDQFEAMSTEVQRLHGIEQELELFRRLDVNPRDLETFTTNKAAIRHYLKLVPKLLE